MSREVAVSFARLHEDLFFGSKSFGKRLDTGAHNGLKMSYDKDDGELTVSWNGATAHIPSANIASYSTDPAKDRGLTPSHHPMVAGVASAQVETPHGHVHAGPGKGKSR